MGAVRLPSNRKVLLSDTVGFIRELPPGLIAAFRATLEEVVAADLLIVGVTAAKKGVAIADPRVANPRHVEG